MPTTKNSNFMEDSEYGGNERRHKRFFRFDPTVSSGTLIQLVVVMSGAIVAYGTYQADKTQTKADIETVRLSSDNNRIQVQTALTEIKVELREMRDKVDKTAIGVEVLKAQGEQHPRRP